ncbi:uncharacterized protein LOC131986660 [Centropristis striata]|uniref:uncharacterized protein LOC131986660 n=1 Tax=Centropristis striata TaxID=184440 RepID=UPI0027E0F734|nr:uncharacterized protein LOC131986660 [Centropristis striata]
MVDSCCAPGCRNSRKHSKGKSFYRIPKNPERRNKWIAAIRHARTEQRKTKYWEPKGDGFRLCSDHFISGKKSENPRLPDYVPSIFKHDAKSSQRKECRIPKKSRANKSLAAAEIPSTDSPQDQIIAGESPARESTHRELESEFQLNPDHHEHSTSSPCCSENCKNQTVSLTVECKALSAENVLLNEKMERTELNEMSLRNYDKKVNSLTGLPTYSLLMAVFQFVGPHLKPRFGLTSFQQWMLALIKLRLNLTFDFLAYYFDIDPTSVSKVFRHCISVMYCRLVSSLVQWPARESLIKSLPHAFRNSNFEKAVCIIDFFKIRIEKPKKALASSQCNSRYKQQHTMKYLIAIFPQGSICFISNGWGGRTSDKFITEQSDFLTYLLPGDLVLSERGFNVKESSQVKLKIAAFTLGNKQLNPVDLGNTEALRTHIERVTGVLRHKYTILQSTVPRSFTAIDRENDVTYLDKMVKVCCALANVTESVLPFK